MGATGNGRGAKMKRKMCGRALAALTALAMLTAGLALAEEEILIAAPEPEAAIAIEEPIAEAEEPVPEPEPAPEAGDAQPSAPKDVSMAQAQFAVGEAFDEQGLSARKKTLAVGSSFDLSAYPDFDVALKATSSNSKVASVTRLDGGSDFRVKAKAVGSATITVKAYDGKRLIDKISCKVTVKKKPTAISLNKSSKALGEGESVKLKAALKPSGSYGKVKWSSSDPTVATVSGGKVTAVGTGTARIYASLNSKIKASCKITVKSAPSASNSRLVLQKDFLGVGETGKLSVKRSGSAGAVKKYSSSDKGVVSVTSDGKVKGVKKGSATITAQFYNGATIRTKIQVIKRQGKLSSSQIEKLRKQLKVPNKVKITNYIRYGTDYWRGAGMYIFQVYLYSGSQIVGSAYVNRDSLKPVRMIYTYPDCLEAGVDPSKLIYKS